MSGREWLWCWFCAACVAAVAFVILLVGTADDAHAETGQPTAPGTILVNRHDVVTFSNVPSCMFPAVLSTGLPCSVGFGTDELAYWIGPGKHKHYVWGVRPHMIVTGRAHWARPSERRRLGVTAACWVQRRAEGSWRYQCPTDPSDG